MHFLSFFFETILAPQADTAINAIVAISKVPPPDHGQNNILAPAIAEIMDMSAVPYYLFD